MTTQTITPEIVSDLAHKTYRLRLDTDGERARFDALEPRKQKTRTEAYEPVVRAVLLAMGWSAPERKRKAQNEGGGDE